MLTVCPSFVVTLLVGTRTDRRRACCGVSGERNEVGLCKEDMSSSEWSVMVVSWTHSGGKQR
jgi:hypothetical protein